MSEPRILSDQACYSSTSFLVFFPAMRVELWLLHPSFLRWVVAFCTRFPCSLLCPLLLSQPTVAPQLCPFSLSYPSLLLFVSRIPTKLSHFRYGGLLVSSAVPRPSCVWCISCLILSSDLFCYLAQFFLVVEPLISTQALVFKPCHAKLSFNLEDSLKSHQFRLFII